MIVGFKSGLWVDDDEGEEEMNDDDECRIDDD